MATNPSAGDKPARISPVAAGILAWLVPGLGHFTLGHRARGMAFFVIVCGAAVLGVGLEGNLGTSLTGPPLALLRTLGCMGAGLVYGALRFVVGFVGSAEAPGYEYGSAFLVSAGLMNYMLVLDAFDIAMGRKK